MKFVFTRHAIERCRQRSIKIKDVKSAVRLPDKVEVTGGGSIQATKRLNQKTLVVRFETDKEIRKIITAFYEN